MPAKFHRFNNFMTGAPCSCFALIVCSACLLFLVTCGPSAGEPVGGSKTATAMPAPTRLSTATTAAGKAVLLQEIHMFNASTGWSLMYDPSNKNRVLHTTAGVTHWQDVTPAIDTQYSIIDGTD